MSGPPQRLRGSHLAQGLVWAPDAVPVDPAAWDRWLGAGDRVFDLPTGERVLWFRVPRRMAGPPAGADLVVAVDAAWSTLAGPRLQGLPPHHLEVGSAGRRHIHPMPPPGEPPPVLFAVPPVVLVSTTPVGGSPPVPPDAGPAFGLVSRRLGLVRVQPVSEADELELREDSGQRSRVGDWIARWGAGLLRDVLAVVRPDAPRPSPRSVVPLGEQIGTVSRQPLRWRSLVGGLAAGLGAVVAALGVVFAGIWQALTAPLRGRAESVPAPSRPPAGPSVLRRLWDRVVQRWSLLRMGFGLERHHARLLREVVAWFEAGDLLEALRHAIPLGGSGDAPPTGWFMGRLGRRERLQPGASPAGSGAVAGGEEVLGLLRRLYEEAHQRLHAEGDVERAAWVLAELMRDPERALGYLQEHARPRMAAEWADLLDLPLQRRIWLWVQAGDLARAARLGRLDGTFISALLAHPPDDEGEGHRALRRFVARRARDDGQLELAVRLLGSADAQHDPALLHAWLREALTRPEHRPWAVPAALRWMPGGESRHHLDAALSRGPESRAAMAMGLVVWPGVPADDLARVLLAGLDDIAAGRTATVPPVSALLGLRRAELPVDLAADLPDLPDHAPHSTRDGLPLVLPPVRSGGPRVTDVHLAGDHQLVALLGRNAVFHTSPFAPRVVWSRGFSRLVGGPGPALAIERGQGRGSTLWWLSLDRPPQRGPTVPEGHTILKDRDAGGLLWTRGPDGVRAWELRRRTLEPVWSSPRESDLRVLALAAGVGQVRALLSLGGALELWVWDRAPGMVLRWRRPVVLPAEVRPPQWFHLAGETVFVESQTGVLALATAARIPDARVLGTVGDRVILRSGDAVHSWDGKAGSQAMMVTVPGGARPTAARGLDDDRMLIAWEGGMVDLVQPFSGIHLQRWDVAADGG